MSADKENKDMEYLRKRLEVLEEPELPASLSPEALFARMDRGELTLPEEETQPEEAQKKVIPWNQVLRRGLPLAACLALVVLAWQGTLGKITTASDANLAGVQQAPALSSSAAAAQEAAPYRMAADEAEDETAQAPENAAQEKNQSMLTAAPPQADGSAGEEESASAQDAEKEKENPPTGGGGPQEKEDPDTGGGTPAADDWPDTGGDGLLDSVGPDAAWDQAVQEQISAIAAEKAPEAGLTPWLAWWWCPDDATVEAKVIYRDAQGEEVSAVVITFLVTEGDTPSLELDSIRDAQEKDKPAPTEGRIDPDPGLGG